MKLKTELNNGLAPIVTDMQPLVDEAVATAKPLWEADDKLLRDKQVASTELVVPSSGKIASKVTLVDGTELVSAEVDSGSAGNNIKDFYFSKSSDNLGLTMRFTDGQFQKGTQFPLNQFRSTFNPTAITFLNDKDSTLELTLAGGSKISTTLSGIQDVLTIVSNDADNLAVQGTDNGAYVGKEVVKALVGEMVAGATDGLDYDALTGAITAYLSSLTDNDTDTIDTTIVDNGNGALAVKADLKISTNVGNTATVTPTGLFTGRIDNSISAKDVPDGGVIPEGKNRLTSYNGSWKSSITLPSTGGFIGEILSIKNTASNWFTVETTNSSLVNPMKVEASNGVLTAIWNGKVWDVVTNDNSPKLDKSMNIMDTNFGIVPDGINRLIVNSNNTLGQIFLTGEGNFVGDVFTVENKGNNAIFVGGNTTLHQAFVLDVDKSLTATWTGTIWDVHTNEVILDPRLQEAVGRYDNGASNVTGGEIGSLSLIGGSVSTNSTYNFFHMLIPVATMHDNINLLRYSLKGYFYNGKQVIDAELYIELNNDKDAGTATIASTDIIMAKSDNATEALHTEVTAIMSNDGTDLDLKVEFVGADNYRSSMNVYQYWDYLGVVVKANEVKNVDTATV